MASPCPSFFVRPGCHRRVDCEHEVMRNNSRDKRIRKRKRIPCPDHRAGRQSARMLKFCKNVLIKSLREPARRWYYMDRLLIKTNHTHKLDAPTTTSGSELEWIQIKRDILQAILGVPFSRTYPYLPTVGLYSLFAEF